MANILVTGGAGYIGSHVCKALSKAGHTPITYDNLSRGFKKSVKWGPLVQGDLHDFEKLKKTLHDHKIQAVMHFAAFAYIRESVENPQMYFQNNVDGSIMLLEAMRERGVKNIVFSSTCATYGEAQTDVIDESHPQNPINPYGLSKLMVEKILIKYQKEYGFNFCGLRYFNAAGADPELEIGESHDPEPHIIPNIIKAGLQKTTLSIFGNNYPTPDGTCVRDFVHVSDLAQAHVLVLEKLLSQQEIKAFYNLGNSRGYSLLELLKSTEKILNQPVSYEIKENRPGDPAKLVGCPDLFIKDLSWQQDHSSLDQIIQTAINWYKKER